MEGADASKKRSISWGPCPHLSPSLRDRCSALGLHIAHLVTKWTWEEKSAGTRVHNLTLQRWENQVTGCPGLSDVRSKADSVSGSSKFCNLCFTKCFIKEPVTHCHRNKNFLFRSFILSCYFTQVIIGYGRLTLLGIAEGRVMGGFVSLNAWVLELQEPWDHLTQCPQLTAQSRILPITLFDSDHKMDTKDMLT